MTPPSRPPVDPRITSNVRSMINQGADETEIDDYIASEGMTVEAFKSGQPLSVEVASDPVSDRSVVDLARQEMIDAGMPAEEIQKFSKDQGLPEYQPEGASITDNIQGAAASLLDGAIPYLSDNVAGVGGVINNGWRSALGMEDFSPSAGFESGKQKLSGARDRFEEENPLIDDALGVTGFVGSLAMPITKFGQAAHAAEGVNAASKTGNAMLNGAATGGIYGTVGGALNDTGGGRLENAVLGGAAGTALGAAAPPLLQGAMGAASWGRRSVPGANAAVSAMENQLARLRGMAPPMPAATQQANRMVGGSIASSPPYNTPGAVADEVFRRDGFGVPAMPTDLSEGFRSMTQWALHGKGPMTTRARQALAARQSTQGTRIRQHVQDELGDAVDPIQAVSDISQRASRDATPNYRQAYNEGMTVSQEMQDIMATPVFRAKLNEQAKHLEEFGKNPKDFGFIAQPDGSYAFGETPSLEAVDMVIRKIQQDIPKDAFGKPVLDSFNYRLNDFGKRMDAATREANPLFDAAKSKYADEMAIRDALEQGQKVGRYSGHDINAQTAAMPQHAQEAWMTGASTALSDRATKTGLKPTANVAADIQRQLGLPGAGLAVSHGDAAKLGALENLTGRPGSMGRLGERLELEDDAFQTFAATNRSQAAKPDFGAASGGAALVGSAVDLATGGFTGALLSALRHASQGGGGKHKQEVQEQVANILTQKDPLEVQRLMRAIEGQAATDAARRARMGATGTQIGRAGAVQFGGLDADPYDPR